MDIDYILIPDESFMENVKFGQIPSLPKIEFEINKVRYKAVDLRLVNSYALRMFELVLQAIKDDPNDKEITVDVTSLNESDIFAIKEIMLGLDYSAIKVGRKGFNVSGRLFSVRISEEINQERRLLTINFSNDFGNNSHIKAIHNYLNSIDKPCEYTEIVRVCSETALDEFNNFFAEKKGRDGNTERQAVKLSLCKN